MNNKQRAFDAAYDVLVQHTQHAQVRGDIAERIVYELQKAAGSATSTPVYWAMFGEHRDIRRSLAITVHNRMPEQWRMSVPTPAVQAALTAAATELAKGSG